MVKHSPHILAIEENATTIILSAGTERVDWNEREYINKLLCI